MHGLSLSDEYSHHLLLHAAIGIGQLEKHETCFPLHGKEHACTVLVSHATTLAGHIYGGKLSKEKFQVSHYTEFL